MWFFVEEIKKIHKFLSCLLPQRYLIEVQRNQYHIRIHINLGSKLTTQFCFFLFTPLPTTLLLSPDHRMTNDRRIIPAFISPRHQTHISPAYQTFLKSLKPKCSVLKPQCPALKFPLHFLFSFFQLSDTQAAKHGSQRVIFHFIFISYMQI